MLFSCTLDLELFYLISGLCLGLELNLKNNVSTLEIKWKPLISDKLVFLLWACCLDYCVSSAKIVSHWNSKCNTETLIDRRVIRGNVIWFHSANCYYVPSMSQTFWKYWEDSCNPWYKGDMCQALWKHSRSGCWFRGVCVCVCMYLCEGRWELGSSS